MKYLTERSLYYYFLMREVADADEAAWGFTAGCFGVKNKDIKQFEKVVANKTLDELETTGDIEMYGNYLNGFFGNAADFGKAACEREAIDAKALAIHKLQELFGDSIVKNNRLRSLSHNYERDHVATVLYALQLLYLNGNGEFGRFAESILTRELKEGKNSDAGLILLTLKKQEAEQTAACLKTLPDMLLRPDMLKYLTAQYGSGNGIILKDKPVIGF